MYYIYITLINLIIDPIFLLFLAKQSITHFTSMYNVSMDMQSCLCHLDSNSNRFQSNKHQLKIQKLIGIIFQLFKRRKHTSN